MSIGGESEVIIGSLPAPDGAEMLRFGEIALAESLSSLQPETSSDTAEPALAIMTVEEVYFAGMTPEERPIGYEMMEEDCTRWLTVLGLAEWIWKIFQGTVLQWLDLSRSANILCLICSNSTKPLGRNAKR